MSAKKRKEIAQEVEQLAAKGEKASQKATALTQLAQTTQETFKSLGGAITAETSQILNHSEQQTQHQVELQQSIEIREIETVYEEFEGRREEFENAISANQTDIHQIQLLESESNLLRVDSHFLQQAGSIKQEEISFLDATNDSIELHQQKLKKHLDSSKERRKSARSNPKYTTLGDVKIYSDSSVDSGHSKINDEPRNEAKLALNLNLLFQQVDEIEKSARILLKDLMMLILMGGSTILPCITNSNVINFVNHTAKIVFEVVDNTKKLVELSNQTIGADWSPLPNNSVLKGIAEEFEDKNKLHFGTEEVAELADEYANSEEEKSRKRRQEAQKWQSGNTASKMDSNKTKIEPSNFAKSLSYGHLYGKYEASFEEGQHGMLQALLPNGQNSGCYINYLVEDMGRIKINDIQVPSDLRGQQIASLLFQDLEDRAPPKTVFFFTENEAAHFWESVGFQFNDTTGEYYRIKPN
jgi:hypothetical protein